MITCTHVSRASADKTCLMIGRACKIVLEKYIEYGILRVCRRLQEI